MSKANEPNWDALEALAAESRHEAADIDDDDDVVDMDDDIEVLDETPAGSADEVDDQDGPAEQPPVGRSARSREAPPRESSRKDTPARSSDDQEESVSTRRRTALRSRQPRPGQEDTARSPLVLGLIGGSVLLVFIGAIFYFMINRQTAQEAFEVSQGLYNEGKFNAAITSLDNFLGLYGPNHELSAPAMILREKARIDQTVRTQRDYPKGLQQLRGFEGEFQDYSEEFDAERPYVADTAQLIALEAAKSAGRTNNWELLKVSDEARSMFTSYASQEIKPAETVAMIESAKRAATAAIRKHEAQQEANAAIETAMQAADTMAAIHSWRTLVSRYPDLRTSNRTRALLQAILDRERQKVAIEDLDIQPVTEPPGSDVGEPVAPVFFVRTSTDEVSGGRAVLAVGGNCCYGIDSITGQPVWRRVIGLNSPFFPVVDSGTASAIVFDTRLNELVRLDVNSGEQQWRVPLQDLPSSQPLITAGRILVPTLGGHLYEVELDSGNITRRVNVSQPVSTPVVLPDEQHLLLVGHQEVFYLLEIASLQCARVDYVGEGPDGGHAAGSILAPLLVMGPFVLVCENNPADNTSSVQLLDVSRPDQPLRIIARHDKVEGLVVDPPAIRGQDLYVPSTGERVTVFTVSDAPGQPHLTYVAQYPGDGGGASTTYLSTGPERQVWMASDSVRRLQVTENRVVADEAKVIGLASQPLQYVDRKLFSGRRRPYTSAVTITPLDRRTLEGNAQAVLAAPVIAVSAAEDGSALNLATEAGTIFQITRDQWSSGGLFPGAGERLALHQDLAEPLVAAAIGRGQIAVAAGGPEPKMWILNRLGKVDRFFPLTHSPQASPAPMAGRVLMPLAGRMKLVSITSGQSNVEEFTLPTEEVDSARWVAAHAVSDTDAVGILRSGHVLLLRYETSPRHYLNQVTRVALNGPVHLGADAAEGLVAVVDASNTVHLFDASSLAQRAARQFESVSNDVWLAGEWLFVETGRSTLHCLSTREQLNDVWTMPLDGESVAGRPLSHNGSLLIPLLDGRVLVVNPRDGSVQKTISTGQTLTGGPFVVGSDVLCLGVDGSLLSLTPALVQEAAE